MAGVRTAKPWMNRLAAQLKPVFIWNLHALTKARGESLAKRLEATLLRFETREPFPRPMDARKTWEEAEACRKTGVGAEAISD